MKYTRGQIRRAAREVIREHWHETMVKPVARAIVADLMRPDPWAGVGRPKLSEPYRSKILQGAFTVADVFAMRGCVEGGPYDYDLSEFTAEQRGVILAEPPRGSKPLLPDPARRAVLGGQLTVADLFEHAVVPGARTDYDLSEFSQKMLG